MYVCLFYILFWRVPLNCKEKKPKNNIYCPVEEVRYLLWTATIWTTIWKTHLVDGSEWFHAKENVLWENIIPARKVEPHNKPKMKVIVLRKNGFDLETKMFLNFWRYFFLFVCFNHLLHTANTTPIFKYRKYNVGVVQTLQAGCEL